MVNSFHRKMLSIGVEDVDEETVAITQDTRLV
jgi:hypothetical protein